MVLAHGWHQGRVSAHGAGNYAAMPPLARVLFGTRTRTRGWLIRCNGLQNQTDDRSGNAFTSAHSHQSLVFPGAIHILAAVAEHEREMISERTRLALAAAKARLGGLGNLTPRGHVLGIQRGIEARGKKAQAWARAAYLLPTIETIWAGDVESFNDITKALAGRGMPAPWGGQWRAIQVQRTLEN